MSNNSSTEAGAAGAFAKHKTIEQHDKEQRGGDGTKMSLLARFLIFIFIPSFTGLTGLGVSYLQSIQSRRLGTEDDEDEPHEVNFDRDFVTPFLLALAFVIVIGFQTSGFSKDAGSGRKGAFAWPTTKRVQKIRRERVIVDDDDKKEQ